VCLGNARGGLRKALGWGVLRRGLCLHHSAFILHPCPIVRVEQQRLAPLVLDGVASDEVLLGGEGACLPETRMALKLRCLSAPGTALGFGQRLVLAPGLGGGTEGGAGGSLGRRAWIFGNHEAAPAEMFIGPIIDKGIGAATHGLRLGKKLGMCFEQLRIEGRKRMGGGGAHGFAQAPLQSRQQSATLRRGTHVLHHSTGVGVCLADMMRDLVDLMRGFL